MYLFSSEMISLGHSDRTSDLISDSILDAVLEQDPSARVGCEVTIGKDFILLSGEISTIAKVDYESVARQCVIDIGYDRQEHSFDGKTCEVINKINTQSLEIAAAVIGENGEIFAGDQGQMHGYACDETNNFMPLAHHLALQFIDKFQEDIDNGRDLLSKRWDSIYRPDAKSQVTVQYSDEGIPERIDTVVISTCHKEGITLEYLKNYTYEKVVRPVEKLFPELFDKKTRYLINPAGTWNVGGGKSDAGCVGRKIICNQYGSYSPVGGGAFSGKDPSKVDRSAAFAARYIAKNIVATGLLKEAKVQIAYAIGVKEPVSVRIESGFTKSVKNITPDVLQNIVDLTPSGIIKRFDLKKPIYKKVTSGNHFGRKEFPWENLDLTEEFKKLLLK